MGGILTDQIGQTSISHLYACGEVACTGVHGANRIASHSLLEALIFGKRCADAILSQPTECRNESVLIERLDANIFLPNQEEIQNIMFHLVGILRHDVSLRQALKWFDA